MGHLFVRTLIFSLLFFLFFVCHIPFAMDYGRVEARTRTWYTTHTHHAVENCNDITTDDSTCKSDGLNRGSVGREYARYVFVYFDLINRLRARLSGALVQLFYFRKKFISQPNQFKPNRSNQCCTQTNEQHQIAEQTHKHIQTQSWTTMGDNKPVQLQWKRQHYL